MRNDDILFFTNEYYTLLRIINAEEHVYNKKRYTPLLHEEIALTMNCSRQTVGKMIQTLIHKGYLIQLMKGRIQITLKGKKILKLLECED